MHNYGVVSKSLQLFMYKSGGKQSKLVQYWPALIKDLEDET
jgi:hypothetical protein